MGVKDDIFDRGSFAVGDGKGTRFWEDTWLGNTPLAAQYPSLYNIVRHKNVVVNDVLSHNPLNIGFRRVLTGNKWLAWLDLVEKLMGVDLSNEPDKFKWRLTQSSQFTLKSMYVDYMNWDTRFLKRYLWRLKVPLKIKIFMWFLYKKVLLTKDNLAKRRWHGCKKKCVFCDSDETIDHLFISCSMARLVWRAPLYV